MADTNAVLIQIRGDVADINAKLADLKGHIGKVSAETKQMAVDSRAHFGTFSTMAGNAGDAVKGFIRQLIGLGAAYKVAQGGRYLFEKGFTSVEQYSQAVASMAAMVTTFTERQKGVSLSDQWKEALAYSQAIVPILENIAAKTLLSGQETTALANAFARTGVFLDASNAKQVESFTRISNALPLMTQGQEIMRQINTEIRAVMTGANEATSMMLQTLKAVDPQIESNLKKWREEGTVLENIGELLVGFGPATELLENQWQAVKSTIDTTVTQTLRGGMFPVYEDIIKQTQDINSSLEEHKDSIQGGMKIGWLSLKEIVGGVKEFLGGFGPILSDITGGVGAVAAKWYVVIGAVRPIGELIANQIVLTYELVKMIGNAVVMAGALATGQTDVAKVAYEEAKKSFDKVSMYAVLQKEILSHGIDDSIENYERQTQAYLKEEQKRTDAASKRFQAKKTEGTTDEARAVAKANAKSEMEALRESNRARIEEMRKQAKAEEAIMKFNGASALAIEEKNWTARLNIAWEKYYNELVEIEAEANARAKAQKGFDREKFVSEKTEAAGKQFEADYGPLLEERNLLELKGAERRRMIASSEIRYDRQVAQEALALARTKEGTITAISAEAWEKRAEYHRLTGEKIEETDAETIQALIDEYKTTYVGGIKSALLEIEEEAENVGSQIHDVVKDTFSDMEDTLAEFIVTGENSFEDFADSVLKSLTKIVINQTLTSWLAGLGKQLTSATSGTAFGSILSAIFGSEHGNIFSGGRIVPFAKGGTIVFNPTLFPMANGTGLMGEAGPEAVLPLTRLSNGNLGVQAATSQTQPTSVSVQIKNESGQEQKIKNSEASWNGQELIVTVWLDAFQRNAFGLRTALGG